MTARETALTLLLRWSRSRALADDLLEEEFARTSLSAVDRALATELFYGCLRQKALLDHVLATRVEKLPRPAVAWVLRLGLYQLLFMDRVPAHAAVDESVKLAKHHASPAEARFVNAVLRRSVQLNDRGLSPNGTLRETEPWTFYSHPRWLWERWVTRWGAADTARLCEWNNQPPPVYVRVNTLKSRTRVPRVESAGEDTRDAYPTAFHPLCYRVEDPAGLFTTTAWKNGELYIQDPSTLLAVDVLDPQPGEAILDLCSAPGGKTTYLAQKMQNRGNIIAADSSNDRLGRVAENCQRLGVSIVATLACEGTRIDRCLRGRQFDRVLVDAPCSNTGVMRRRADLRWRVTEGEIQRLAELQGRLLAKSAETVRPGGVVVYSTCSLEAEENDQVVERFLKTTPAFALESSRQLFPPRDGVDGAFVTRLRRLS